MLPQQQLKNPGLFTALVEIGAFVLVEGIMFVARSRAPPEESRRPASELLLRG